MRLAYRLVEGRSRRTCGGGRSRTLLAAGVTGGLDRVVPIESSGPLTAGTGLRIS